jgi:translation elongation factor P/translation initiation factor 5A
MNHLKIENRPLQVVRVHYNDGKKCWVMHGKDYTQLALAADLPTEFSAEKKDGNTLYFYGEYYIDPPRWELLRPLTGDPPW